MPDTILISVMMAAWSVYVTMFKFGLIGFTQCFYVSGKEKIDTSHWMVEVKFNGIQAYPGNHTCKAISILILQGNHISDFKQSVGD